MQITDSYVKVVPTKKRKEIRIAHCIMIVCLCSMIEDFFYNVSCIIGVDPSRTNYISWGIYGLMIIIVAIKLLRKCKFYEFIFFIFLSLIIIFISELLTPKTSSFVIKNFTVLFISNCIAFFLGKYGFISEERFKSIVFVTPFYSLLNIAYLMTVLLVNSDNYMNTSYNVLFITCIYFAIAFSEHHVIYYLLGIINTVFIFLRGASGPFLTIFILFFAILFYQGNTKKRLITIMVFFFFGFLTLIFHSQLLLLLCKVFPAVHTVIKISNNSIWGSPRVKIWKYCAEIIKDNPFRVRGIFADRLLITYGNLKVSRIGFNVSLDQIGGLFAHNIIIELFIQFGIVIGLLLIVSFTIKTKRYCKIMHIYGFSNERKYFLISLFCIAIVPLLFSHSYLLSFNFWLLLGVLNSVTAIKQYNKSSSE